MDLPAEVDAEEILLPVGTVAAVEATEGKLSTVSYT
nr:hypothetical protein [Tanacetum cinerariifolium]